MNTCAYEDCSNKPKGRGLCHKHFVQEREAGTLRKNWPTELEKFRANNPDRYPGCSESGCDLLSSRRGLCDKHYYARKEEGTLPAPLHIKWINTDGSRKTCPVSGCDRPIYMGGLCRPHYSYKMSGRDPEDYEDLKVCPSPGCGRAMRPTSQICKRCNQFRWRYSLTVEQVISLNENRVCLNPGCGSSERVHLDHDHSCCPPNKFETSHKKSCGKCVRGWLCSPCNKALGMLQENPRRIEGLLEYLESHS